MDRETKERSNAEEDRRPEERRKAEVRQGAVERRKTAQDRRRAGERGGAASRRRPAAKERGAEGRLRTEERKRTGSREPGERRRPARDRALAAPEEFPGADRSRNGEGKHLSEKEKARRREAHRKKVMAARIGLVAAMLALVVLLAAGVVSLVKYIRKGNQTLPVVSLENVADMPEPIIKEDFLPFNEYSRPGTELPTVKKLFIHYTANPGTSAKQNRDYFAGLAQSHETSASSHYVIGYNGEILQCLPLKEIGYAVKGRNFDSISVECCYLDESGVFTEETYQSLLKLTAWLLQEYHLTTRDVLRHYDEGGKNCPKYYVEHEEEWERFQLDLYGYIEEQNEKAGKQ